MKGGERLAGFSLESEVGGHDSPLALAALGSLGVLYTRAMELNEGRRDRMWDSDGGGSTWVYEVLES